MTYDTNITIERIMSDISRKGTSFMPTLLAPTEDGFYRAIIICRPGRTARRLRDFAPSDSMQSFLGSERSGNAPLLVMGSAAWFAPFSTADAIAFCVEPIDSRGRPQFKQAVKWLRKQGSTTISTLEQLDREATKHHLQLAKAGRLDS